LESFETVCYPAPEGITGKKKVLEYRWPSRQENIVKNNWCDSKKINENHIPKWLGEKVDKLKSKKTLYQPSNISDHIFEKSKIRLRSVSTDTHSYIDSGEKGVAVHTFLQYLPTIPLERYPHAVKQIEKSILLTNNNKSVIEDSFKEAKNVLSKSELSFLHSKNCCREMNVSGVVDLDHIFSDPKQKKLNFNGRIDCLCFMGEELLIIDFKTNAQVPKDTTGVDIIYMAQLQIYASLLQKAYPQKIINTGIVWTKTAELMIINLEEMSLALSKYFLEASS
jgi:ATP-dependent exoDNAse (exonuclease V) beta subunit